LTEFFKAHFPKIKLAIDMERAGAVAKLADSGSFASTHRSITELSAYDSLTDAEVDTLVDAALNNSQIRSIICDNDVSSFYQELIDSYESTMNVSKMAELRDLLA
jgi:hypothetical protein